MVSKMVSKSNGASRIGRYSTTALMAVSACALLSGCSAVVQTASTPAVLTVPALQGSAFGGQQPISGAAIYFYAAGASGYGSASTNLLTVPVSTNASGEFTITGDYSCTAGQQLYLVAAGGNPGGGINNHAILMAALGDCANLPQIPFVSINEVTTVGSVFALAPFMSSYSAVGTSPTNVAGLARAFASVNKLVNVGTGAAVGPSLPAGATGPTSEIYSLANVLASCVNSVGGFAGDGSACGHLFSLVTPSGWTAPTDTIGAALAIARNPTSNVTAIFNLTPPISPFSSGLNTAPSDWTMSINYTGSFNSPRSTTVDANGNIWVANPGNNTVTVLSQTGATVSGSPLSANGLNGPASVAIDGIGNAWVANSAGSTVSVFTGGGAAVAGSPFNGSGNLSLPSYIAMDAPGNIWVASPGSHSLVELDHTGTFVQQIGLGIGAASSLAINPR
jgi:hypothetical protein